ncbi:hypothetical protein ACVIGB_000813 [Bradyrhizobium sp. USDA 4341]
MRMIETAEASTADDLLRTTIRTEREHRLAYEAALASSGLARPAWTSLTEEDREEFRMINRLVWAGMPTITQHIPLQPTAR